MKRLLMGRMSLYPGLFPMEMLVIGPKLKLSGASGYHNGTPHVYVSFLQEIHPF